MGNSWADQYHMFTVRWLRKLSCKLPKRPSPPLRKLVLQEAAISFWEKQLQEKEKQELYFLCSLPFTVKVSNSPFPAIQIHNIYLQNINKNQKWSAFSA